MTLTNQVWSWYQTTDEPILSIGSAPDFGVEVYAFRGDSGLEICAEADGELIYDEEVYDEDSCLAAVNDVVDTYLSSSAFDALAPYGEDDDELNREMIDDRESELDDAVSDFLSIVLDGCILHDIFDICEDFKEHAIEYIYKKYELPIYRPMILEDEDGNEFFEEYPYDHLDLSEED